MWTLLSMALAVSLAAANERSMERIETRPLPYVDRLLPFLAAAYGLKTPDELRRALQRTGPYDARYDGGLAKVIGDFPRQLDIYEAIGTENLTDPIRASAALAKVHMGRLEEALQDLEHARRHGYGSKEPTGLFTRAELVAQLCRLRRSLGQLNEAREECEAAIKAGARAEGSRTLAKVLIATNHSAEAFALAEESIRVQPTASAWYAKAVSLETLGRRPEAVDAFKGALRVDPYYAPAEWALETSTSSAAARLQLEIGWQTIADAEWTGRCGHIYVELGLPERAERCFAESERIDQGLGTAERIYHLAETNPTVALQKAEAVPAGQRHRLLWWVIAAIHHQQGRDAAAKPALERALDRDPRYAKAHRLYVEVCEALHESECVRHHQGIMAGEPGR